jgi:5'(3')-deoxyribonucleotidase
MKQRIAFDQDEVLAELTKKWLAYYNRDYSDNIRKEDIKSWGIENYVKPECGIKIYDYLSIHKFYRDLEVVDGAVEVTKELTKYYDLFVVTDAMYNRMSFKAKFDWLQELFPHIPKNNIVFCGNKSIVAADYLIDDGLHNINCFTAGKPIVYDAPWNASDTTHIRVHGWKEIAKYFLG